MHTIRLTDHEAGQRLDRFLRKLLPTVPLGAIFKHLRNGAIRVDGKKAKQDLRLAAGMELSLYLPDADVAASPPRPAAAPAAAPARDAGPAPRLVFADDDVLIVDKPAGVAAQPGSGPHDDLVAWLERSGLGTRTATFRPAPAHRLDRGTSGLVAIGLSPHGLRALTAAFRDDQVEKVYFAVVHGLPSPAAGSIEAPLCVLPNAPTSRPKAIVADDGKPARTDYEVVDTGRDRALLRLVLHTGRLHQIRAHLVHVRHPIVGDRRYGSTADLGRGVFLLHAAELELPDPRTGERRRFTSPVPPAFARALRGG